MYTEGSRDYVFTTPIISITLQASGSISAGQALAWDAGNTSCVYVASNVATGSPVQCAGIALKTVSSGQEVPICVMGVCKNLIMASTAYTYNPGMILLLSGSGGALAATTLAHAATIYPWCIGEVITGSGNNLIGFISMVA